MRASGPPADTMQRTLHAVERALREQGQESLMDVPSDRREEFLATVACQLDGVSVEHIRNILQSRWSDVPFGSREAERVRLGLESQPPVRSPASHSGDTTARLSPLAAVRFAQTHGPATGSGPRHDGETHAPSERPKQPNQRDWLHEHVTRPASYWLRRATGRLPMPQHGLQALEDPTATVVRKRKLGGGVNGSFIVELSNGAKAVWKPSSAETMKKLRDCIEEDHQARREVAAFIIDRWLGHLAHVPPTVLRDLDGEPGALMEFVAAAPPKRVRTGEPAAPRRSDGPQFDDYRHIAIFDHVIGNLDRHSNNWLEGEDGALIPIDHGLAFPLHNGAPGPHKFYFNHPLKLRPDELAALDHLIEHRREIESELAPLLAPAAIDALFDRVETMVRMGTTDHAWRAGGHAIEQRMLEGVLPAE